MSHKSVSHIVHKHRQTGSVADKPRNGRPKSTTPRQDEDVGDHVIIVVDYWLMYNV